MNRPHWEKDDLRKNSEGGGRVCLVYCALLASGMEWGWMCSGRFCGEDSTGHRTGRSCQNPESSSVLVESVLHVGMVGSRCSWRSRRGPHCC